MINKEQKQKSQYIWYNPTNETYEMGDANIYKRRKLSSTRSKEFTLLYKLSATSGRLGKKLICELNRARRSKGEAPNYYEVNLAS